MTVNESLFRSDHAPGDNHARGRSLRLGVWYIVAKQRGNKVKWELYSRKQDPLELKNLAKQMSAIAEELTAIWQAESVRHARQAKIE